MSTSVSGLHVRSRAVGRAFAAGQLICTKWRVGYQSDLSVSWSLTEVSTSYIFYTCCQCYTSFFCSVVSFLRTEILWQGGFVLKFRRRYFKKIGKCVHAPPSRVPRLRQFKQVFCIKLEILGRPRHMKRATDPGRREKDTIATRPHGPRVTERRDGKNRL